MEIKASTMTTNSQNPLAPSQTVAVASVANGPSSAAKTDFAPGIEQIFADEFEEGDVSLELVAGQLPSFVRGTYYLNGPARFGRNGLSYKHWLDGDGMICRLHFTESEVKLKNRYIKSTKLTTEQDAGRFVFRTFGTAFEGDRLNKVNNGLESPVNVSVYPFNSSLLAFGEQGLPWEINPHTLETVGQYTFGGRLNDASPFSAHPKLDVETGEMFNFGVFFSSHAPKLYLYCFNQNGLRFRKALPLPYACSAHDFIISKRYAIFYLTPYVLDISGIVRDGHTVLDSLHWQPERGSIVLVASRETGALVATLPVGNRYCLHLANAYDEDERLVVDLLEFDSPIYPSYQPIPYLFQDVPDGGPVRLVIDLGKQTLLERKVVHYTLAPDFPTIDPRLAMKQQNDSWMLGISATGKTGRKFFDQLVHVDWQNFVANDIYHCPPMHYLGGEPVFIGAPGESVGAVLCQEFDAEQSRSFFVVFDAHAVAKGPTARFAVPYLLPLQFHAVFQPD